jgi:hypothetical protein
LGGDDQKGMGEAIGDEQIFPLAEERMDKKMTLSLCRNCHTKDQSPAFNYLAYLEKIGCKITK